MYSITDMNKDLYLLQCVLPGTSCRFSSSQKQKKIIYNIFSNTRNQKWENSLEKELSLVWVSL